MSEKRSLAVQRACVEHLIALHPKEASSILDGARQAALTLAWLERHQELMRALDRLQRERPDLADLFRAFPGAEIADVRSMYPMFKNGSGAE
jgi:hypothetical protein